LPGDTWHIPPQSGDMACGGMWHVSLGKACRYQMVLLFDKLFKRWFFFIMH
jgi:hypothetical protein